MRKVVTLQFPSNHNLWDFWNQLPRAPYILILEEKKLTQSCTEHAVELAVKKIGAVVIELPKSRMQKSKKACKSI